MVRKAVHLQPMGTQVCKRSSSREPYFLRSRLYSTDRACLLCHNAIQEDTLYSGR